MSQQYSNAIKEGTTLNFFIAFSIPHCSSILKTKTIVNNGQLKVGIYEICF